MVHVDVKSFDISRDAGFETKDCNEGPAILNLLTNVMYWKIIDSLTYITIVSLTICITYTLLDFIYVLTAC